MLLAGWIWRDDSVRHFTDVASLAFSSGGLVIATIFGWTGKHIAEFISEKRIQLELIGNATQMYVAQSTTATPISRNTNVLEPKLSSGNLIKSVSSTPLIQN